MAAGSGSGGGAGGNRSQRHLREVQGKDSDGDRDPNVGPYVDVLSTTWSLPVVSGVRDSKVH